MKKHYRKENDCLNCGTILEGRFCHNCGQENLQMKESFGHMMNHAISDYFHFDEQFFHTLKPLFFSPGKLTNEYMAGHRAQYLHPVKMYIFISLVYFVLLFKNNDFIKVQHSPQGKRQHAGISYHALDSTQITSFEGWKKAIADSIKKNGGDKEGDNSFSNNIINLNVDTAHGPKTYAAYLAKQAKLPADKQDNFFMRYVEKKSFGWQAQGKNAQETFLEEFKHDIPKMMFVLLPLFALIMSIAFYKSHKFFVEHLIYAFHLHCFLFLYLTITMLIGMLLPQSMAIVNVWISVLSFIIITWYVYTSLRVVYHRSVIRTITKMIGVSFSYLLAFSLCMTAVVLIVALFSV